MKEENHMNDEANTQAPQLTSEEVEKLNSPNLDAFGLPPETTPTDIASTLFGLYWPKFKAGVLQLSSKQRARLLLALVEYPLQERDYNHNEKLEKDLFNVGMRLLESKYLMIIETYAQNADKLRAALEQPSEQPQAESPKDINEGERSNG